MRGHNHCGNCKNMTPTHGASLIQSPQVACSGNVDLGHAALRQA